MFRIFGHYVSKTFLLLGVLEFFVSFLALFAGVYVRFDLGFADVSGVPNIWTTAILYGLLVSSSMLSVGLYQRGMPFSSGVLVRLALSFAFVGMAMSLFFYTFPALLLGRGVMAYALIFTFAGVLLLRWLFFRLVLREVRPKVEETVFDLGPREVLLLIPLAVLVILIGVQPELALGYMHTSVDHLLAQIGVVGP